MFFTNNDPCSAPHLLHFYKPASDFSLEFNKHPSSNYKYHPNASIYSNDDNDTVKLTMDLPGVKADDLEVQVENKVLSVSGKRCVSDQRKKTLEFCRKFELDTTTVDSSTIAANLVDGVLTITMQKMKKPEDVMMKIAITTNPIDESMGIEDEEEKKEETEKDVEEEGVMVETTNETDAS
mmetsp:Transcript_27211/g.41162  ORF Transcript_27211/g.41162 Transcript_27211/m.41162 type:complete len:180 (+) Transcript_27211:85-624(+)|eukprot:CAMPEP_0178913484 /NCGR_PEP_ID=MMETSP0786-20121207/10867_1 /TAXON_ID=186022 /ORGANISM="Thalassionema frauenfeldii, Strain CCMP 1798" /LENGTH=179 /DNA_ID=CAMNT_0020586229 /DNA_START=65 /DNA_END=604 /DNA_ORIENTATION=-